MLQKVRCRVAAVMTVATLVLAGCSHPSSDTTHAYAPGSASSIRVARGSVVAVVTLDGVVVATPAITAKAPVAGSVTFNLKLRAGSPVRAGGNPLFSIGGRQVRSPVTGTFQGWRVADGAGVAANVPVAIIQYSGFGIEAATPPDTAYRIFSHNLSATAQIRGGPASFDCPIEAPAALPALPDPNANQGNSGSTGTGPSVTCTVPLSLFAVAGLRGFIAIRSASATNVLVLPTSAVAGDAQSGAVWLVGANGRLTQRRVTLGVSNGAEVEIRSGLALGDIVSSVAPDDSP